jgi:hypothetical protein
MHLTHRLKRLLTAAALASLGWLVCAAALATPPAGSPAGPQPTELRFGEMFASPVGPRGLQPSAKLLALNGQAVRMLGYMAATELPMMGRLILTPLPASLGDEDEHLADDLPATAVFVHLSGPAAGQTVPNRAGLIRLQGRLALGPQGEADGHVSTVRLLLDAEHSAQLLAGAPESP